MLILAFAALGLNSIADTVNGVNDRKRFDELQEQVERLEQLTMEGGDQQFDQEIQEDSQQEN